MPISNMSLLYVFLFLSLFPKFWIKQSLLIIKWRAKLKCVRVLAILNNLSVSWAKLWLWEKQNFITFIFRLRLENPALLPFYLFRFLLRKKSQLTYYIHVKFGKDGYPYYVRHTHNLNFPFTTVLLLQILPTFL